MTFIKRLMAVCMDGRRINRMGRRAVFVGLTLGGAAIGSTASADLVLSFDSLQTDVTAAASTVSALVQVAVNTQDEQITTLTTAFTVTKSNPALPDIAVTGSNLTGLTNPAFTAASPEAEFNASTQTFGVSTLVNPASLVTTAGSPYSVLNVDLTIPQTLISGFYTLAFQVNSPNNGFTDENGDYITTISGNNGSTTGVITLVPESGSNVLLASGAFVVSGAGLARRRLRERKAC